MWPNIKFLISKLTFNSRFWISNCQFDIRSSIFDIRTTAFFILLGSKNLLWHSESYRIIFLISKLTFNARFWISNCQFVIRYSIFELPLFFVFLWSKTFFSNRNVTEYQVLISKLTFNSRFWISNCQFDIRSSIFDIRTTAFFHLIRGQKPSLTFGKLPNINFLISKLTFNARFWISNYQFDIRYSIFDIRTAAVFHLISVEKPS